MELSTARLIIRPLGIQDANDVYRLSHQPHVAQFMPNFVYDDPDEITAELAYYTDAESDAVADTRPWYWALARNTDGTFIGHLALSPYEQYVEVAFAIDAAHCGLGYATEAVAALTYNWLKQGRSSRIYGVTEERNMASARVLEKAGFTLEAMGELPFRGQNQRVRKYVLISLVPH